MRAASKSAGDLAAEKVRLGVLCEGVEIRQQFGQRHGVLSGMAAASRAVHCDPGEAIQQSPRV